MGVVSDVRGRVGVDEGGAPGGGALFSGQTGDAPAGGVQSVLTGERGLQSLWAAAKETLTESAAIHSLGPLEHLPSKQSDLVATVQIVLALFQATSPRSAARAWTFVLRIPTLDFAASTASNRSG